MVPSIQKLMKNPGGPLKNWFYASLNDDNLRKMVQNEENKFFGNLFMLECRNKWMKLIATMSLQCIRVFMSILRAVKDLQRSFISQKSAKNGENLRK